MNNADRKQVVKITEQLNALRETCTALVEELTTLAETEREKFDNLSEGLQASEPGQELEVAASTLEVVNAMCDEVLKFHPWTEKFLFKHGQWKNHNLRQF